MRPAGDSGSAKTVLAAFSVEHRPRAPVAQKVLPSGDYPGLEAIAIEYVAEVDLSVTHACLAVPGPVSSCGAVSKSEVSRICQGLDEQADAFRNRPLEGRYSYLWLDAKVEKVRHGGRVVRKALVLA
jgi:hypothetical protein